MFQGAIGDMVGTSPVPENTCEAWPLTSHPFFGADKGWLLLCKVLFLPGLL